MTCVVVWTKDSLYPDDRLIAFAWFKGEMRVYHGRERGGLKVMDPQIRRGPLWEAQMDPVSYNLFVKGKWSSFYIGNDDTILTLISTKDNDEGMLPDKQTNQAVWRLLTSGNTLTRASGAYESRGKGKRQRTWRKRRRKRNKQRRKWKQRFLTNRTNNEVCE